MVRKKALISFLKLLAFASSLQMSNTDEATSQTQLNINGLGLFPYQNFWLI